MQDVILLFCQTHSSFLSEDYKRICYGRKLKRHHFNFRYMLKGVGTVIEIADWKVNVNHVNDANSSFCSQHFCTGS